MVVMRRTLLLLCGSAMLLSAAELANVRSVYLLPMARGMDQYLANRLTEGHVFQVVVDPKLADAVFTDRLGEGFEAKLDNLLPKPAPPDPEPVAKKADKAEKGEKPAKDEVAPPHATPITDTVNRLDNPALNSSFGRGRGTVFLVDAKSRDVVWSTYDPVRGSTSKDLDRTASDIVDRLKKQLGLKK
jgi:hypothetical protein